MNRCRVAGGGTKPVGVKSIRAKARSHASERGSKSPLREAIEGRKYNAWLLDQFGVLHDGVHPYPAAIELIRHLAEDCGAKLVILSNSSRRSETTFSRLEGMGFKPEWFSGCVTSGDVAYHLLSLPPGQRDHSILSPEDPLWEDIQSADGSSPRQCLHFTWSSRGATDGFSGNIDLQGLNVVAVSDPAKAEFILCHGTEAISVEDSGTPRPVDSVETERLLEQCAQRSLPMLVANPDLVTVQGTALVPMPGSLARKYSKMTGSPLQSIHLLGKPSPVIYNLACKLHLQDVPRDAIVSVGDSLEHDIKGANQFGVDSVFISRGIHGKVLHGDGDGDGDDALDFVELDRLVSEYEARPTILADTFAI